MRRTLALLLSLVVVATVLTGCAGNGNGATASKQKGIPVPEELLPAGVNASAVGAGDTATPSMRYYEQTGGIEAVKAFYTDALATMDGEILEEKSEEQLLAEETIPVPEKDALGTIAWAGYGTYNNGSSKTHVLVTVAMEGEQMAIIVAVGDQAGTMATAYKMNPLVIEVEPEVAPETSTTTAA